MKVNYYGLFVAMCALALFPTVSFAATPFEVSGWIPYWKVAEGTKEAQDHISTFAELNPFVFTVQKSGALKDLGDLNGSDWRQLFLSARDKDVRIIPTITTSDGDLVSSLLSSDSKRAKHIKYIVSMVKKYSFDGVDIDYEGKKASTREDFSLFLKELKEALGSRMLVCSIEARTPPDSLYNTVPDTIEYANDLNEINNYCDTVHVMTYDQQRADLKLNNARKGTPYIPVSDISWVRKVMKYMAKDIDKDKLVIGIPTYGAEWTVTVAPDWYKAYAKQWALNPSYATDLAETLNITPTRNAAGEMSFTYLPDGSPVTKTKGLTIPSKTLKGDIAAVKALSYANKTGKTTTVNVVWWSDATAIKAKVDLAKELGLRGVALFKIDGGMDQNVWSNVFK